MTTPDGVGRVGDVDVLRERVRVHFEEQPPKVFAAADVQLLAAPAEGRAAAPGRTASDAGDLPPDDSTSD